MDPIGLTSLLVLVLLFLLVLLVLLVLTVPTVLPVSPVLSTNPRLSDEFKLRLPCAQRTGQLDYELAGKLVDSGQRPWRTYSQIELIRPTMLVRRVRQSALVIKGDQPERESEKGRATHRVSARERFSRMGSES